VSTVGSCAAEPRKSSQVRKEAALRGVAPSAAGEPDLSRVGLLAFGGVGSTAGARSAPPLQVNPVGTVREWLINLSTERIDLSDFLNWWDKIM